MDKVPYIFNFPSYGDNAEGFLFVAETFLSCPFVIKRTFWTSAMPNNITRGRHAHYNTEMILIAVTGLINVSTINCMGETHEFLLSNPGQALFLPRLCWHEMTYDSNSIQLVLASTNYDETDYIRDKQDFLKMVNGV